MRSVVLLMLMMLLPSMAMAAAATAPTTSPAGASASPRQRYSDRYAVLSDRNIFLRERARPTTQPRPEPAKRTPEESFILTGIVAEDEGIRAYFEDIDGQSITKAAIGDSIARGKISAILIDAIEYESSGRKTWVEIGSDLTGKSSAVEAVSASDSPTTAPAEGSAAAAKVDPNDPNLSMEQRLRLRRLQELNRR